MLDKNDQHQSVSFFEGGGGVEGGGGGGGGGGSTARIYGHSVSKLKSRH